MDVGQSEMVRHNIVKDLIPMVVRHLLDSVEYKKSQGKPFSLLFTARWLGGVGVSRMDEDLGTILAENVNMYASSLWILEYKLFSAEYPYIKKIVDSYQLPLGDIMNICPDIPTPEETIGSSKKPTEPVVENIQSFEISVFNLPGSETRPAVENPPATF